MRIRTLAAILGAAVVLGLAGVLLESASTERVAVAVQGQPRAAQGRAGPAAAERALPLNCGHRGARQLLPENTVESFQRAFDVGADCVEMDLVLSKAATGQVLVAHPKTLAELFPGRTDTVQAGTEVAEGYAVPSLAEFIERFGPLRPTMLVEFKGEEQELVDRAVGMLRDAGLLDLVWFNSYNQTTMRNVKAQYPELRTGYILGNYYYTKEQVRELLEAECRTAAGCPFNLACLQHELLDTDMMRFLRGLHPDMRIATWTADEPAVMRKVIALGVDAIVTNNPQGLSPILFELSEAQAHSGPKK